MKLWPFVASAALLLTSDVGAIAHQSRSKAKSVKHSSVVVRYYAPGGGCGVRDNAAPIRSLNNPCEQAEFWRRIEDKGRSDPRAPR